MEELEQLVMEFKYKPNRARVNISPKENQDTTYKRILLKDPVYSNSVKEGRTLELVQIMLPEAGITQLTLNRDVVCARHRDKANSGLSWICFFGEYTEGGDLLFEDGTIYPGSQTGHWHGPFDGKLLAHWNTQHYGGCRWSVVGYST